MWKTTPQRPGKPEWAARASSRAFSMLELVLVLVVVGVVAAMAVPRYGAARSQYRVQAAAQRAASDYLGLRQRAMAASGNGRLLASDNASKYTIEVTSRDASGSTTTTTQTVDLSPEPYRAAIFDVSYSKGSDFGFDAYGNTLGAGTLTLRSTWTACQVSLDASGGASVGAARAMTSTQRAGVVAAGGEK
ncbi:MAG: prepilin-type N-terminal cleavage/methylation domain-containing protein [Tepidisphaera sp.]|nr:prepilin-type N-terminal cleavage/methylation domain-containing protein [Tepidisphaera sp.]